MTRARVIREEGDDLFIWGKERKIGKRELFLRDQPKVDKTPEAISRALVAAGGRISYASIILGITPKYLRRRIHESDELTKLKEEIQEFRIDIAENKLDQRVLDDKYPAIQFLLETQGKHRGYTKRTEVTGAGGDRLVFEFSDGKKEEL